MIKNCRARACQARNAEAHPDLQAVVAALVDAQLLLRLLRVHRHLQLVQQAHIPPIIIQRVDACSTPVKRSFFLLGTHRHLQLIQQAHVLAIITQYVNAGGATSCTTSCNGSVYTAIL